jgi:hypothetical protein
VRVRSWMLAGAAGVALARSRFAACSRLEGVGGQRGVEVCGTMPSGGFPSANGEGSGPETGRPQREMTLERSRRALHLSVSCRLTDSLPPRARARAQ